MHTAQEVQTDFDQIALVSGERWSHNHHYHSFMLKHVPAHCEAALEIGCGTGTFSRLLAQRSDQVLAIDLSPEMIRLAQGHSAQFPNIEYQTADALSYDFPAGGFDCIASIATLHHLPMREMLDKMREALRPKGSLLVLDLLASEGVRDLLADLVGIPLSLGLRLLHTGRFREPREVREAWAKHGRRDSYLTGSEVDRICRNMLPGVQVRRHLLWRYSIVWRKPAA